MINNSSFYLLVYMLLIVFLELVNRGVKSECKLKCSDFLNICFAFSAQWFGFCVSCHHTIYNIHLFPKFRVSEYIQYALKQRERCFFLMFSTKLNTLAYISCRKSQLMSRKEGKMQEMKRGINQVLTGG